MMTLSRKAGTAVPTRSETSGRQHITATNTFETSIPVTTTIATKDVIKGSESFDMRSQTCVEFLHIMKEFSESSCDASETVQRVDSLVSQDEQLLRLFPLSRTKEDNDAMRRSQRAWEDNDSEAFARIETRDEDKELETQDDLQRWMDLDLGDLDHHMDVFDFQHAQPLIHSSIVISEVNNSACPATSISMQSMKRSTNSNKLQKSTEAANSTSAYPREKKAVSVSQRPPLDMSNSKSLLNARSDTSALINHDNDSGFAPDRVAHPPLKRAKLQRPSSTPALRVSVSSDTENKADTDDESKVDEDENGNVWGMENDGYEHDLLSSIDHSVLCDRENRFLQWDLEVAHQQEQQRSQTNASDPSVNGMTIATSAGLTGLTMIETHRPLQQSSQKVMASSPMSSKSPSNVEIVEDWNSLDFGTFQNRTVSHILSTCLHKRKLHHPYKNQVQLVNFRVPSNGDVPAGRVAGSHPHQLGGSLATSLAFGGQQNSGDGLDGSTLNGFVPLLASGRENVLTAKSPGKGEKKTPKKREERKRLMTLKMQETFADLEGTFTEQDLDVKGIVGPGASLSKMALSKLENLPLPDLTNLPQDLRELKCKIEATEHKVEGTKHRHRKGGPCPRCQVQNQLRAAKRAYHKRAVAHKKLPHVVVNAVNDEAQEAANAQAAAAATLELAGSVTAAMKAASVGARKGSATLLTNAASNHAVLAGMLTQVQRSAASSVSSPSGSLCSTSSVATTVTVGSTSGSSSSSSCGSVSPPPLKSAQSIQSRFRIPYSQNSSTTFTSPSSATNSPKSATNSSSPDSHVQHVTVTSG
ncbi:uncharacterized protein PHALS_01527 [Plasmopara halstedii]|uniref:Uncharacterized protein n=1 Tax=Plasmopara halstedii TaxID=4781 RepID=A0A0P1AVW1_PLAHL|nr:uncharacterized protein PHALS_01527 [Plasmopara halstedii]CEG45215.1 hypothetical protein PHALS_01527 [Plasmopara halstedii]|eukprot:XP_024581584.1 hypothetical protein PHALS_01527 [Plasmopara halstedii]